MCAWAPIGFKGAVSLCSPALLTSSLHTECAQRTGASLIPLIWGASWDLTKHSSDKDARSQRCCGIPTTGGKQAECFRVSGTEKCFLQYMKTVTWHKPLEDLVNPSQLQNLYHPWPPLHLWASLNANQTGDHLLSPAPVCGYGTRLSVWGLTPDCSSLHLQIIQLLCQTKKTAANASNIRSAAGETIKECCWISARCWKEAFLSTSSKTGLLFPWNTFPVRQCMCILKKEIRKKEKRRKKNWSRFAGLKGFLLLNFSPKPSLTILQGLLQGPPVDMLR